MAINIPAPINPQGFTNQNNITGMFGSAVPGTFNRNVAPELPAPPTDPLTGQVLNPLADTNPNGPVAPPVGVQTPITPIYDINNQ